MNDNLRLLSTTGAKRTRSHESLHELFNSLSTAIVTCDVDLKILYINPSAQSLLDISDKNARGESVLQFFVQPSHREALGNCLDNAQPIILRHADILDAGHRSKLIDCILAPVFLDGADCLTLEFNEVNALARKALEDTMDRSQSANSAVIRNIAHEIKNPLGGLRGAAQLLDRELREQSQLKNYTKIIIQETDRLCNLVDTMATPQIPLKLGAVNVHEILEHVCALTLAEKPGDVSICRDYDPSLPPVLGDREQLIQAVLNIVRNAVEAADGYGSLKLSTRVARQVTIDSVRHQSAASIGIEDQGPGIPPDIIDHVFYPMISGRAQGDGLGLSIVHQIIKRHGGHITCDSRPGKTRFTILLKFADRMRGLSVVPGSGRSAKE